ncbi:deoxyribose-phosphate aldolase [Dokdonia sinensis]|uniref:Deoxyribose-phosphate aldolase n=1 Tax=Dokdonia sinensis TaxID=2479847 RepID=A0A3M0G6I8_9FLAO|nr:DUF6503 family protein [Dokdonia sinensis]RMB60494.1 deoxyribose-phosphate aldolase [Dokdonia sinensis]
MKVTLNVLFLIFTLLSCQESKEPSAQEIVDLAIASAGGDVIENASIHFKFRDYYYRARRENGLRTFERCTDEACMAQQDILKPDGEFVRFRESVNTPIPDSMKTKYGNSVNSVHYFSVLPYGLNDPAVTKTYVDKAKVKGRTYHRIKVTFAQEGGGEDYDDNYMYWIDTEDYSVDYLAYNYQVNEGGTRFREAYNERFVNGVRFVDYNNYKPAEQYPPLTALDSLFENNALQLLSKIELENPEVQVCPEC